MSAFNSSIIVSTKYNSSHKQECWFYFYHTWKLLNFKIPLFVQNSFIAGFFSFLLSLILPILSLVLFSFFLYFVFIYLNSCMYFCFFVSLCVCFFLSLSVFLFLFQLFSLFLLMVLASRHDKLMFSSSHFLLMCLLLC